MTPHPTSRAAAALAAAVALLACSDSTAPPPPLEITTESLPDGSIDAAYAAGISATGGDEDYEWSVTGGALPPGLTLAFEDLPDGDDLVISGDPTTTGSYTFTVRVESGDGQFDTKQFGIQIHPQAQLVIENLVLPPALVGGPYDVRLRTSGPTSGELTWSLASGTLPPGLTLTEAGRLHGTPTATDTGLVTLRVTDGTTTVTEAYELRALANDETRYNITPVPVAPIPGDIRPHVEAAIAQWESVLTGDLSAVAIGPTDFQPEDCAGFGDAVAGTTIDDVFVLINIAVIDGPGQILGRAGPCATRRSDTLTVAGILTLDSEDLLPLAGTETLTHILAHEIGHILGFGTLWLDGLLVDEGTSDPRFTGANAVAEWHALGGAGDVPVEETGGQGTAGGHWRESVFGTELMTGFSHEVGVFQPLSRVTIGSMEDLGYQVDYGSADAYTLGMALLGADASGNHLGYDVVLDLRIHVIDDTRDPLAPRTRSQEGAP